MKCEKIFVGLIVFASVFTALIVHGYADTDGTEIQITDQADRLIIQFGPQWAGTKFELKTDDGIYPSPVIVDSSGLLKMDLGGSKTYVLSCIAAIDTAPQPELPIESPITITQDSSSIDSIGELRINPGKPVMYLVLLIIGFAETVIGITMLWRYVRRKKPVSSSDELGSDE